MTDASRAWTIRSPADAAGARVLLARTATRADVPVIEQARFLTSLTAHLRECLGHGGAWELSLRIRPAGAPPTHTRGQLEVTVRPAAGTPHDSPPWRLTLACPRLPCSDPLVPEEAGLAEALLAADDDTATILARLDEQEELVRFHREELHQTNQGVLALHAELDASALAQRKLLAAERDARTEAEKARRLLTFLADASAEVTSSLDHEDIMRRLPRLLVPQYARHVDVWIFDDAPSPPGGQRPAAAVAAARTGRPQHAAAHPGGLPGVDDLPQSRLDPTRPLLCLPLSVRRTLGVLTLAAPGPRFDPDTCLMLLELARRIGIALDHARRYEQHRDTAEALQRAQLTELPTADGLLLAARYLPATRGLNIGGDWYDAFPQPDGSLLAVVGDVTGHGLRAAIMMGHLRTALRAYAVEGDSPAQLLTRLHRLLRHQQPELYATAAIARFRPGDPTVVWAAAGHPPPLVRTPDATVRVLDAKPGIMLGVPVPHTYQDHTVELPTGSTLALYTDGLVERRARLIDLGIGRLARALSSLSTTGLRDDLDAAAESLLEPLLDDSERDDDVCLLLCHTTLPALPRPFPDARTAVTRVRSSHAEPAGLPGVTSPRSAGGTRGVGVDGTRGESGCREDT
ncbi:serine phosphatase RsbU (regulator of sigma subunit) [Streptomyces sp. 3330]|uniref:PP2C family protein-serine/threonine phosphatase n=1 Tax=Streptomyces sp. 3330 TaxID=2817755 RepID=UPI00285736C1|nr:SpoIIE family protein phosphatase [Streptomyces sp. 3330]MDR6974404.1 serine phosphatase RsbU (regulator of sigma subunit) [Streptomyces sp. 3330]